MANPRPTSLFHPSPARRSPSPLCAVWHHLRERADHAALAVQTVPNLPIAGLSPGVSGEFTSPGIYLQIVDEAGRVVARSTRKLGVSIEPIFNVHSDYAPILSPKRAGTLGWTAG